MFGSPLFAPLPVPPKAISSAENSPPGPPVGSRQLAGQMLYGALPAFSSWLVLDSPAVAADQL